MTRSFYRNENEQRTAARENLNQYLKTTSILPLMLLTGTVIILVGMIVWVTTVGIEKDISVVAIVENGIATCYATEEEIESNGWPVVGDAAYVNGVYCTITSFNEKALRADPETDAYVMQLANIKDDDWIYQFTLKGELPDGIYHAKVVTGKTTVAQLLLQ